MRNTFVSVRGASLSYASCSCTRPRRGAVLPLVAVSIVMLMSLLVLVLDGGSLQRYKRLTQTAADAGALAAASEMNNGQLFPVVAASAREEARTNGFTDGNDGAVITVNPTPVSGYFAGKPNFVEVIVQKTVPMLFAGIMGIPTKIVTSRAVAGFAPDNACFYVLSPTAFRALEMNSGAELHTKECGIQVNSSNNTAVYLANNSPLDVDGGIAIVGNTQSARQIIGTVLTGAPPAPDPLAYLQMPTMGACTWNTPNIVTSTTLSPGVYCGGLHLSTSGQVVTLNPGIYYMAGGGLEVKTNATLNGNGVNIVLTNAPGDSTGQTYGFPVPGQPLRHGIYFTSGGSGTLTAKTDGPLAGVLFYQDPAAGRDQEYTNEIFAGANLVLTGSMYFPTQELLLNSGAGRLTITGGIVAKTVSLASNSNITITGISGGTEYFALKKGSIVE